MNREGFFFFVILIFLIFFYFLKRVISTQTQKISDCKINVLKVERVQNTFKNLNSSEMTLKILKIMQIYQNVFFWGFRYFFVIFYFFWKFIKNMG
jgi:hypothetical protein